MNNFSLFSQQGTICRQEHQTPSLPLSQCSLKSIHAETVAEMYNSLVMATSHGLLLATCEACHSEVQNTALWMCDPIGGLLIPVRTCLSTGSYETW